MTNNDFRKGSISRGKSSDMVLLAPQDRGKNWKKEVYSNGDEYEGEFNDEGKRHGRGTYSTPRYFFYFQNKENCFLFNNCGNNIVAICMLELID